ncbi:MAG: NAD-dependent DNA ligase LigA [Treponema sp.]|jgi:DNA ligase (NAD+)|nr:NAD-dependent DNA ligase LigA [Treponema sp.]
MELNDEFFSEERIAELEALIQEYQASYYNGEAEISDAEFDLLWDELKSLAPNSPILTKIGADSVDGFPKAAHVIPMSSQEKVADADEFRIWANKTSASAYLVQFKLDGASLELQYENGRLVRAVTRGDGVIGDDITSNARRMSGVVTDLRVPFFGGVRGEVILPREMWKSKYSDKANCRNAANGFMRRKDGAGCEDLVLICYDASVTGNISFFTNESDKINWLKEQGFFIAETQEFTGTDIEKIIAYRAEIAEKRQDLPFDIDGLVIKDKVTDIDDLRRARPERQIAFKFALETAYSVVRSIEWSESGATYTPIAIIDAVRLAGTTVRRASLANSGILRSLGLKIGSVVSVVKRGEIIPKIESLAPPGVLPMEQKEWEIVFPSTCSVCGSPLADDGIRLFCPNSDCPKLLLHRLQKWVKVLDIREIGDKLIRQLFDSSRVRRIHDLYSLTTDELAEFERMGEVSAAKVIRNLRAPRKLPLAVFIAGFDFDGVGETIMEKVVDAGFDTLEKLRAASIEVLTAIYGLGEITAKTIVNGLQESSAEMDATLASGVISIAPRTEENLPLTGISFCFTGELVSLKRAAAREKVQALGGSAKSSVVKGLSYLVTNTPNSESSKNKKARELGVPVIGEQEFLDLLEGKAQNEKNSGQPSQGELWK